MIFVYGRLYVLFVNSGGALVSVEEKGFCLPEIIE